MTSAIDTREGIDGTVMEVIVEHVTHFAFSIDSSGQVTGKGGIVYTVVPNLCGLAVLTKQVNQAVNMMGKLPSIYKFANELGTAAIKSHNSEWMESENRLKGTMESLMEDVSKVKSPVPGVGVPYAAQKELDSDLARAFENMGESKDARALALQTLMLRCGGGGSYGMVGGIPCSIITSPAVEAEMGSIAKEIGKQSQDILLDKLNEVSKDAMDKLYRVEKHEETARGEVGPGTFEQFKAEMVEKFTELGKEEAKGALIGGLLGYVGGNIGTGVAGGLSVPVDMMLSIPGVTQVTYSYKGLDDGPKHEQQAKRKYNMEGRVDAGGAPKLYLTMDELSGGPNSLTVKYMVNYKWDQGKFPAFSPFLEKPGEMHTSGDVIIPQSSLPGSEPAKGKGSVPTKEAKPKAVHMTAPFAVFHQTGTHRNGVTPWQEYEYYWFVHKVTEPIPPAPTM